MFCVVWTCLRMCLLIKYECLNNHILMKPTVNYSTAGVFIVGLVVWNDANKESDQREDVMWVPTRLHGPFCCSAPGFHLLRSFSLKTTQPRIHSFPSFSLWPKHTETKETWKQFRTGWKELYWQIWDADNDIIAKYNLTGSFKYHLFCFGLRILK